MRGLGFSLVVVKLGLSDLGWCFYSKASCLGRQFPNKANGSSSSFQIKA